MGEINEENGIGEARNQAWRMLRSILDVSQEATHEVIYDHELEGGLITLHI